MSGPALAISGTPPPNPDEDSDHDGLTDTQETVWNTDPFNPDSDGDGFKDGEEVASGHDPLKPGPDDLIPQGGSNITDQVSTLVVSGLSAGNIDNNNSDQSNQALADISYSTILDAAKALDSSNIQTAKPLAASDTKDAQEKYVNALGLIIQEDLWAPLVNEPRVSAQKFAEFNSGDKQLISDDQIYFNTKAAYYKNVLDEVASIPVPPSWLDVHGQIMDSLKQLIISHQSLAQTDSDPIKSTAALNNLTSLYQNVRPMLSTIVQRVKENNLTPPDGALWNVIVSLTDGSQ